MTQMILATTAANTVNENSKTLLVSAHLRNMLVKGKYFRKPRTEKLSDMQTILDDLAIIYEGYSSSEAASTEVLKNLAAFKTTAWAELVFSFVSPSMYIKLLTKRMDDLSEEFQTRCFNEIVEQWKNRVREYMLSSDVSGEALIAIGNTVKGNVALSTAYNEVVLESFRIPVYDEDAVQELPTQLVEIVTPAPVVEISPEEDADA